MAEIYDNNEQAMDVEEKISAVSAESPADETVGGDTAGAVCLAEEEGAAKKFFSKETFLGAFTKVKDKTKSLFTKETLLNVKNWFASLFRPSSLDKRKARYGWIFVLPFVIGILCLYLPVIVDSISLSLNKINTIRGGATVLEFRGLEFYNEALFKETGFVESLGEGILQLIFDIPAIVIFSLFIAVVLNQRMLGRAVFRAIFFVPVIISTGLMDSLNVQDTLGDQMQNGSIETGSGSNATQDIISAMDIELLFANMKVGTEIVAYVTGLVNDIYDIINRSGVQMLIFLAGLQSISPAIYEACTIEGATAWETFWKITFPMISPMILVNAIYTIIDSFTSKSNIVMTYISGKYEAGREMATAMSWIYFLVIMLIIAAFVGIASMYIFYQKRD